jgi:hypothetical protein
MNKLKKTKRSAKQATKQVVQPKRPLSSLKEGEFNSILDRALNKNEDTGYSRAELNREVNRRHCPG